MGAYDKYWEDNDSVNLFLTKIEGTHWSPKMPGFGLRVSKRKSVYICRFRDSKQEQHNITLGDVSKFTLKQAMDLAQAHRDGGTRPEGPLTLAQGFEEFIDKRYTTSGRRLSPTTIKDYRGRYERYLKPYGDLLLETTKPRKWVEILDKVPKGQVNGTKALLSGIYTYFNGMDELEIHPIRNVTLMHKYRPNPKRTTKVQTLDLPKFLHNLDHNTRNKNSVAAVQTILFTGVRKSAGLQLLWDKLHLDEGYYDVDDPELPGWKGWTGLFPLSDYVLDILKDRYAKEDRGKEYVFSARHGQQPYMADVRGTLKAACQGMDYVVTLHDLRRTFATLAKMALRGDTGTVGMLLTHKWAVSTNPHADEGQITYNYIVEENNARRAAANRVVQFMRETGGQLPMSDDTLAILKSWGYDPEKLGRDIILDDIEDDE